MPRPAAKDRQFMMYFPSQADRERWRKLAKKAKMSFTDWIYSMVEARLVEESEDALAAADQKISLQAENRQLRRELQNSEARISDLETEIFKLRNQLFSSPMPTKLGDIDKKLMAALRSGGTWANREILQELGVDANDIEAIEIVTKQLQSLQDLKLVKESARGWRWIS